MTSETASPAVPPHGGVTVVSRGLLSNFNPNVESFETYVIRFELFCVSEGIEPKLKAPKFLSAIDSKSFTLALNLLHPKSIQRATYDEVVNVLKKHYKPKVMIIYERFMFNMRVQKSSESISDFLAALKYLARTCSYGGVLDDMLRDRFVPGMHDRTV